VEAIFAAYLPGTHTRHREDLVHALRWQTAVSKSTASRTCAGVAREIAPVRQIPLRYWVFLYAFLDAT
jgi:putative transposase